MSGRPEVNGEDVRDEESELIFGYKNNDDEMDKLELISDYLPEKNDYSAKTVLSEDHPETMAAIEQLTDIYPEIAHMEDTLVQFVLKYEKRQISVHGRSRDEILDILAGLSGGSASNLEQRRSRLEQFLSPQDNGDDDS